MTPAARIAAAADLLDQILTGEPAERVLTAWARRSRFAGSKDRAAVRDHVFDALRRRRSLAYLGGAETGRALMLGAILADGQDPASVFTGEGHAPSPLTPDEVLHIASPPDHASAPEAVAADMPDWLWPQMRAALGDDARRIGDVLRSRAPVFLRANLRRADRGDVSAGLAEEGIETRPHPSVTTALLVVSGARRIAQSRVFLEGLAELQDAASQAVVQSLPLRDGMTILDYCAGGGGKALAMADRVQADISAHDADPGRMKDLPLRAERAGVTVALTDRPEGIFDLVLCDVPCSGSGAWRRSPEGKWALTPDALDRLNATQDSILEVAAQHVDDKGILAFATCSILTCENEDRRAAFLARHPDWEMVSERRWTPGEDGDGFYLALFRRLT